MLMAVTLFLSSCASPEKPLIKPDTEVVDSFKQDCEDQGKVYFFNPSTQSYECIIGNKDYGKRCTKTIDCLGFCQGNNHSFSSGNCSVKMEPSGCVIIVERGEKFERCYD